MGTKNVKNEETSAIVGKYRRLVKTFKEARIGHIMLSGILPAMGGTSQEYRKCRIYTQVQEVCMEDEVCFLDMWLNLVGRYYFYMRDGLHLTGKGAAVVGVSFAGLSTRELVP